jgi:alginate O-acetyltransferase complex protein AlgJ
MRFRLPVINEESITAGFFLVVIFGLGIWTMSRWTISSNTISLEEKRRLAAYPNWQWDELHIIAFPGGFDRFYNDRFACRSALITSISLLKYRAFNVSSSPKVLAGNNNWLFFMDGGDEETLRHWPCLPHSELENWVRTLEERRAWLAARGIRYVVFVTPTKSTIYREHVPSAFTCLTNKSRLDQLIEGLRNYSQVEVLDIRDNMKQSKIFTPLYCKTDTHWNLVGAFVAYQCLAARLKKWFPAMHPLTANEIRIDRYKYGGGDLAGMAGLYNLVPEMFWDAYIVERKSQISQYPPPPDFRDNLHNHEPFATEVNNPALPTGFCLRDSFMQLPQRFISEDFRRIVYHWRYDFPTNLIEKEKPDVVIQEFTERILARGVPDNPPELRKYAHVEILAEDERSQKLADSKVIPVN